MRVEEGGLQVPGDRHGYVGQADQRLDEDEKPRRQVSTNITLMITKDS